MTKGHGARERGPGEIMAALVGIDPEDAAAGFAPVAIPWHGGELVVLERVEESARFATDAKLEAELARLGVPLLRTADGTRRVLDCPHNREVMAGTALAAPAARTPRDAAASAKAASERAAMSAR